MIVCKELSLRCCLCIIFSLSMPAVSKARHADVAQVRWSGMKRAGTATRSNLRGRVSYFLVPKRVLVP